MSQLNLSPIEPLHRSDNDSLGTLEVCKLIQPFKSGDVSKIDSKYNSACGNSHIINIMYTGNDLTKMLETLNDNPARLSNSKKSECVKLFVKKVKPKEKKENSILNGKKLCFSFDYEIEHTKETIILIQMLADCACSYNAKVSENDYYVATESELNGESESDKHTRYYAATHREDGHNVEILSLQNLLDILGVTEDILLSMKMPTIPKKTKSCVCYSTGKSTVTLGDIAKMKGIDLKSIS